MELLRKTDRQGTRSPRLLASWAKECGAQYNGSFCCLQGLRDHMFDFRNAGYLRTRP